MSASASRLPSVVLHSDEVGLGGHRVRLVLAEKGIGTHVEWVAEGAGANVPDEHGAADELPVLIDRDLVLYGVRDILDYLDERYPHPPLMPMDPVSRARTRLAVHRVERDWYPAPSPRDGGAVVSGTAAEALGAALVAADELFAAGPFLLSDSWSMLDAAVVPLLWRLPHYGIVLPTTATSAADYARRMFARPAFRASLSARERAMALHR